MDLTERNPNANADARDNGLPGARPLKIRTHGVMPITCILIVQIFYELHVLRKIACQSVCSLTVRIIAFQAIDPGSTPGRRSFFSFYY